MVVHINNYDDDAQNKGRPTGAVADSMQLDAHGSLLSEETAKRTKKKANTNVGAGNDDEAVGNIDLEQMRDVFDDALAASQLAKDAQAIGASHKASIVESANLNSWASKKQFDSFTPIDANTHSHAMCIKIDGIKVDEDGEIASNESMSAKIMKELLNESGELQLSEAEKVFKKVLDDMQISDAGELQEMTKTTAPKADDELGATKESVVFMRIMSKLFEDILIEQDPEGKPGNAADEALKSIDATMKSEAETAAKEAQLPYDVDSKITGAYTSAAALKALKDEGVDAGSAASKLEAHTHALLMKLSAKVGKQSSDDGESSEDEQLGTGESMLRAVHSTGMLLEAVPAEQMEKQILAVALKAFTKTADSSDDRISKPDESSIIRLEADAQNESVGVDGQLINEGKHTARHIKPMIDKIGADNIKSNKALIVATLKKYYATDKLPDKTVKEYLLGVKPKYKKEKWDKKQVAGWNKKHPDDKREEGYV